MDHLPCALSALTLYPVKSCAGIGLSESPLAPTGLDLDRGWMVVDRWGRMLTQRQTPRLALIQPSIEGRALALHAPGMAPLTLTRADDAARVRTQVWDDTVMAFDAGEASAQWLAAFLGSPARLLRFDAAHRRAASAGRPLGAAQFSDAGPLLVVSTASLAALNRALADAGHSMVGMARFRPNLVLEGLQPFDEDLVDEITFDGASGPLRLKMLAPCTRCAIPNIDPETAESGSEPGATLARLHAGPDGAVTFGMYALPVEGVGAMLRVGMAGRAHLKF